MPEFSKKSPEHTPPSKTTTLLKVIGHTAMYIYDHAKDIADPFPRGNDPEVPHFVVVETKLAGIPQPLHPDIPTTVADIHEVLSNRAVITQERLSFSDKFTRSTWMTQFTDRLSKHDPAFFEYSDVKELKDRFVASAEEQEHPLSFAQQLDVALELADNNITEALTNLWFTSRQHARWLDNVSILGLPELTAEEIMAEIRDYRGSILACKNADEKNFQDTAGDNYFAWTHTCARVMYGSDNGISNLIGKFLFKHGTTINSHRILKQSIPSDHRKAAAFGNAIGDAILTIGQAK